MSDQCPEESLERNKDIHTNTTYNYKLYRPQEYQADQGYQAYQKTHQIRTRSSQNSTCGRTCRPYHWSITYAKLQKKSSRSPVSGTIPQLRVDMRCYSQ